MNTTVIIHSRIILGRQNLRLLDIQLGPVDYQLCNSADDGEQKHKQQDDDQNRRDDLTDDELSRLVERRSGL